MIQIIETLHQYLAIYCFVVLAITGGIQKNWDYGLGLNIALVLLYLFLYIQPITKGFK